MVRLTDRPDMTLDVYRGRKTTKQQHDLNWPCGRGLGCENKIYLKIFSRTARLRCFKFRVLHFLVVFNQVCSNEGPRIQNGPKPGSAGFGPLPILLK